MGFGTIFGPMFAAGMGFAIAESVVAANLSGLGGSAWFNVFCFAFAWVSFPILVLALPLAEFLNAPLSRRLTLGFVRTLGWSGPGGAPVAVILGLGALGSALAAGTALGIGLTANMSARFASFGIAGGTLLFQILAFFLFSHLALVLRRVLAPSLASVSDWKVRRGSALLLALGAGLLPLLLRAWLPWNYCVAPTSAVLFLALAFLPSVHVALSLGLKRWRAYLATAFLLGLAVTLGSGFERAPVQAQSALHYRAPYVSLVLGGFQRVNRKAPKPLVKGEPGESPNQYMAMKQPKSTQAIELPKPMNVVLIMVDALRHDHLGYAGYERAVSPNIDAFRKRSTWFRQAFTPSPTTRFAMASAFTGLDPIHMEYKSGRGNRFRLDRKAKTIAEILGRSDYDRVGFTISYVLHKNKGTGQGFRVWETPWPTDDWKRIQGKAAELTSDAALSYLDSRSANSAEGKSVKAKEKKKDRYLLFLHYRCTHDPYIKHEKWDYGDKAIDRYDSALSYCDEQIGRVFDAIDEHDESSRTAVILFSDHGELFGEHGLTNHGNSLFETDVRVPLLISLPTKTVETVDVPVVLTDLAPTVLAMAGKKAPRLDGWNLLPLLFEPKPRDLYLSRPIHMLTDVQRGSTHYQAAAVFKWPHKYIRDMRLGTEQLFDTLEDPGEKRDLSSIHAALRASMSDSLDSWLGSALKSPF